MKILDIALKDLVRFYRSALAVGMTVVVPLLITGLIYFAFGGLSAGTGRLNLPSLGLVLVNLDEPAAGSPALGQLLIDYFNDPAMPDWLAVSTAPTEAEARAAVDQQRAGLAVIIPADFTRAALGADTPATLTVIHDPTLTLGPQIVQDLLRLFMDSVTGGRIAISVAGEALAAQGLALDPAAFQALAQEYAVWVTDAERNIHHSDAPLLVVRAPAAAAEGPAPADGISRVMARVMAGMLIFFTFMTGATTAQSILREDEEGTLPRLFTTPTPRPAILAGKFAAVFLTIIVQALVLILASALAFRIQWGDLASLALVVAALTLAAAGLGVCVVAFVKNQRQAGPIVGGVLTVTGMLGGLFTTGMQMPAAFETLNLAFPQGWALRGLKLVLDGADPAGVLAPVLVMTVAGAALFSVGAAVFQKRFA
jgi:ABC-2 type transport system permease protein